jgi:hypothetical protein
MVKWKGWLCGLDGDLEAGLLSLSPYMFCE